MLLRINIVSMTTIVWAINKSSSSFECVLIQRNDCFLSNLFSTFQNSTLVPQVFHILFSMLASTRLFATTAKFSACALRGFATRAENPLVYMDFSAGGKDMGRIVFEVYLP